MTYIKRPDCQHRSIPLETCLFNSCGHTCARTVWPVRGSAEIGFEGRLSVTVRRLGTKCYDAGFLRAISGFAERARLCRRSILIPSGNQLLRRLMMHFVVSAHLGDRSGIVSSGNNSQRGSFRSHHRQRQRITARSRCVAYPQKPFPAKSLIDAVEVRPSQARSNSSASGRCATRPTKDGRAFCLHDAGIHLSYSHLFGRSTPWHWPKANVPRDNSEQDF